MAVDLRDREFLVRVVTVTLFVVLSVAGVGFAIYMFYVAKTSYVFGLAVAFLFLSLVAGWFNIYASIWYFRSYFYDSYLAKIRRGLKPLKTFPTVAIVMPAFNEDPVMVEKNLKRLMKMDYPKNKMTFYLLDDSTDQEIVKALEKSTKKMNVKFIHREDRKGFKAGAFNNALKQIKEDYLAVFDADEYLTNTSFLNDLLPYFQDKRLSYVQTEKRYMKGNFFSEAVDTFDAFFFKFIQPARALNNTAVFAGSCGVISIAALRDIGGFPEYIIEDTFFSFESNMHEYKSLYVPKVYAMGRPVKTFTELAKQQWRYNYGDTQFISYFYTRRGFTKRSLLANMDYNLHGFGLNYLSVVIILFTLVSIGIVFSAVPFAHINFWLFIEANQVTMDLELLGFFAFSLSLLTPVFLTKMYFNSWRKGAMVFLLNYALAFVRTKAAIATIFNKNPGMNWNRLKISNKKDNILYSMLNSKVEIGFALAMFALAYVAFSQSNVSGGVWLGWYGVLYSLTTVFLHKYG